MKFLEIIKNDEEVKCLIESSGGVLKAMSYTEHGIRHATYVSNTAGKVLEQLGYDAHDVELAKISGFLHDVGNVVNRKGHGVTSAILIYDILRE